MPHLSAETRQAIVDAIHAGSTNAATAKAFNVSAVTVSNIKRQYAERGTAEPLPSTPPCKLNYEKLATILRYDPNMRIADIMAALPSDTKKATVYAAIKRLGIPWNPPPQRRMQKQPMRKPRTDAKELEYAKAVRDYFTDVFAGMGKEFPRREAEHFMRSHAGATIEFPETATLRLLAEQLRIDVNWSDEELAEIESEPIPST